MHSQYQVNVSCIYFFHELINISLGMEGGSDSQSCRASISRCNIVANGLRPYRVFRAHKTCIPHQQEPNAPLLENGSAACLYAWDSQECDFRF